MLAGAPQCGMTKLSGVGIIALAQPTSEKYGVRCFPAKDQILSSRGLPATMNSDKVQGNQDRSKIERPGTFGARGRDSHKFTYLSSLLVSLL